MSELDNLQDAEGKKEIKKPTTKKAKKEISAKTLVEKTELEPSKEDAIVQIENLKEETPIDVAEESVKKVEPKEKEKGYVRTIVGGTFFGLGWGISGACAGPIFVILGFKFLPALILLISALIGAFIYGLLSKKLPN